MGPALISYSHYPGVPPCESRADPVAAKRKRKRKTPVAKPWLAIALGVAIAAGAFAALLSGRPLGQPTATRPAGVSAPVVPFESDRDYNLDRDHDRDQIDQASRDRLRAILRAESQEE